MSKLKSIMAFRFHYDSEDDILSVYLSPAQNEETIEFSDYLNIDIDKDGRVIGLEIFEAKDFFSQLNENFDKDILENLDEVSFTCKDFRNSLFILVVLKAKGKTISQPMPLLSKSEYVSPLVQSALVK